MEMKQKCNIRGRRGLALGGLLTLSALAVADVQPAGAASSDACEGGGYEVLGQSAGDGEFDGTVPAPADLIHVQGVYNEFDIRPADFAVLNYAFTGADNEEDITGGRLTPVYESKIPDHRGLVLNSAVTLELDEDDMVIERSGTGGLTMKIQAKDCAQGGIFQMEVERGDNARTRVDPPPRRDRRERPGDGLLLRQSQLPGAHRSVPRRRLRERGDGTAEPVLRPGVGADEHRQRAVGGLPRP